MNDLYVQQRGQFYSVFTEQGILIAQIFMGADGQFAKNVIALSLITKALAKRWGVQKKQN